MDRFIEPSHLAFERGRKAFFCFLSDELSICLAASTISTMRGGRQRPVTAQPTSPPEISCNLENHHAYAIAYPTRRLGADLIDHGINFLWNGHRDSEYGGYYWDVGYDGPWDPTKQAYGHAFVLLVASSAKVAGHPAAD